MYSFRRTNNGNGWGYESCQLFEEGFACLYWNYMEDIIYFAQCLHCRRSGGNVVRQKTISYVTRILMISLYPFYNFLISGENANLVLIATPSNCIRESCAKRTTP
eukprot:TRINITY_DN1443_c0_g1_i1.p1 TRINITY_DN1443_c0_g1~~TRINITY_DN1443_c0_g1_i1.p1  ORF type:complete len:105 (+),score=4.30 TRINITY_DN1443_c0_g1_i1:189-503(+)